MQTDFISALCVICSDVYGGKCHIHGERGGWSGYECDVCGKYGLTHDALGNFSDLRSTDASKLKRAALSHYLSRSKANSPDRYFVLNLQKLQSIVETERLPTPPEQVQNLIVYIGNYVRDNGVAFHGSKDLAAIVGAFNDERIQQIADQMIARGLISRTDPRPLENGEQPHVYYPKYDLTLDGWELYDKEKHGELTGSYGFLARKFNEPTFEAYLKDVKAGVLANTGFELREVSTFKEPGIIDNIMRQKIRESAFVVADLSHGNKGAYWEAGYAEGLGKPVIYICERSVFDHPTDGPHFDTKHCNTVIWEYGSVDYLISELTATIKTMLALRESAPRRS
ncbi:MAG: hypothetical protein ACTHLA_05580 [Asticcacaulis sp.]|uniref:hypothetical protein n=1 Tax=Asticcacaulis sp. TaxID=1872648 RepID=UPI003F7C4147